MWSPSRSFSPLPLVREAAPRGTWLGSRLPDCLPLTPLTAVSHNLAENKPDLAGAVTPTGETLSIPAIERDWAVQQIQTSSNWGGVIGNFFTGGLNLQM